MFLAGLQVLLIRMHFYVIAVMTGYDIMIEFSITYDNNDTVESRYNETVSKGKPPVKENRI